MKRKVYLFLIIIFMNTGCTNNPIGDSLDWGKEKPFITILSPIQDMIFGNEDIIITGTSSGLNEIDRVEVSIDNETYKMANGTRSWNYTYSDTENLTIGQHTIQVKAIDINGNNSIKSVNFLINRNEPIVKLQNLPCPFGATINTQTVTINVKELDDFSNKIIKYKYTVDGLTWLQIDDVQSPIILSNLVNGDYTIQVVGLSQHEVWQSVEIATVFNFKIDLDSIPQYFSINENAIFALSPLVTLNIEYNDTINRMSFSNNNIIWNDYTGYQTSVSWPMSEGRGLKTVYAEFETFTHDRYTAADNIILLDTTTLTENHNNKYLGSEAEMSGDGKTLLIKSGSGASEQYHIYKLSNDTWSEIQTLSPAGCNGKLTVSISYNGDTIAIGNKNYYADYYYIGACSIYNFDGDKYTHTQTLTVKTSKKDNFSFGTSVKISQDGTTLIISAPQQNYSTYSDAGICYIYKNNGTTWDLAQSIPGWISNQTFGNESISVNCNGNYIYIGDSNDNNNQGVVYIYKYDGTGWALDDTIKNPTSQLSSAFPTGITCNTDGTVIAIGNSNAIAYGKTTGACVIYKRINDSWKLAQQIVPSDAISYKKYGNSLKLSNSGDILMVLANGGSLNDCTASLYIYKNQENGYQERQIIDYEILTNGNVTMAADGLSFSVGFPNATVSGTDNHGLVNIYY